MDDIHITFRKIESTEAIKSFAAKKVARFHKYLSYPVKIHVLLSSEKLVQKAEITCHAEHKEMVAVAESENLYESIDQAGEKMEVQLRKERDRKKGHKSAHKVARSSGAKLAKDVEAEIPHQAKKEH